MKDFKDRWALITGASSGIGEEFARQLADLGMNLYLVARREDRMNAIADDLRAKHNVTVNVIAADLLAEGHPERLVEQVAESAQIDLLVNNAGFGITTHVEKTNVEEIQRMLNLNISVLTKLTYAFLRPMLERGSGGIINLASRASFTPVPYMAAYGASKTYVLNFTEALWAEVRSRGVDITAVCPGFVNTEFLDVADVPDRFTKSALTPKNVVDAALTSLRRRWPYVVVGFSNNVMTFVPRLLPRGTVAVYAEQYMRPKG